MDFSDPTTTASGSREDPLLDVNGFLRLLCLIRLVVLLVAASAALFDGELSAPTAVLIVLVAVASYLPATGWGRRIMADQRRYTVVLACDVVVAVTAISVLAGSHIMFVYAAATVAVWGLAAGLGIAVLMAVPLCLSLLPWSDLGTQDAAWVVVGGGLLGVGAMAWGGAALGQATRAEVHARSALSQLRTRRAAADERLRIARDLHDTVAGDLAGMQLVSAGLQARLRALDDAEALRLAAALDASIRTAHGDIRTALGELRRAHDDPVGQLTRLLDTWQQATGLPVRASIGDSVAAVEAERWVDAVAVLRELLENVRKHARARSVDVMVALDGECLVVCVSDDGAGLTEGEVADGHFGLAGVRERVRAWNGAATWASCAGGGTTAQARFGPHRVQDGQGGQSGQPVLPEAVRSAEATTDAQGVDR